jgi:hypothetical protein
MLVGASLGYEESPNSTPPAAKTLGVVEGLVLVLRLRP